MGKTKNRVIAFLVGIAICLIVLEVALRIVGSIYANLSESDKSVNNLTGETVLCVGDSVTFGIGASKEFAYPAQLQKLLNETDSGKKYDVINRGWPGQNSAQLLMRLEKYLQEFKPDIVTILIGAQNLDNYFGYREYLEKEQSENRGFLLNVHDSLDRIRIYKFSRLLLKDNNKKLQPAIYTPPKRHHNLPNILRGEYRNDLQENEFAQSMESSSDLNSDEVEINHIEECPSGTTYKMHGDIDKALEAMLGVDGEKEVETGCHNLIGSIYRERRQYENAITWFKKGIERDSTRFKNYEGLGWSYFELDKLDEAIFWFKKGFEHAAYDTLHEHCYVGICLSFETSLKIEEGIKFFKKEIIRKPLVDDYLHTLANDYLLMFKSNRHDLVVNNWIESDIKQILQLCEEYNAKTILQNYPNQPGIEFIYRNSARRNNIPFVDHQTTFRKYIKNGVRSPEYFVPDGHPNARGYHMMAKNIWLVLVNDTY